MTIADTPAVLDQRTVEARIAWLRTLTPRDAPAAIAEALVAGAPEDELWAAGALCAARYLNNQAQNLLGFVSHAMIGCEDARRLAAGQPTRTRQLLIVQALAQVVYDLHDPSFAPYELLPYWPFREASVAENLRRLRADVRIGEYMRADHRFVALMEDLPRAEVVDLLLDVGLEGIVTDDHTLISPMLCLGMADLIGWEAAEPLLRWALRYSASFSRDFRPYDRALELLARYGLEAGPPGDRPGEQAIDFDAVAALRAEFLAAAPHDRPEIAARALAEGVAPASAIAAASLAACDMYLMTEPVPPQADYDAVSREVAPIHIGTAMNALRAVLPLMLPRTRALAAIQAGSLLERGPSVLSETFAFVPFQAARPYPYEEDVDRLRGQAPEQLLATLRDALPAHDHRTATAAVRAYAALGAPPEPLIALLTAVACTDNGTLLHNFKHLHAMVDEFYACPLPDRWQFLVGAARWAAWYAGLWTEVYDRAAPLLGSAQEEGGA